MTYDVDITITWRYNKYQHGIVRLYGHIQHHIAINRQHTLKP